MRRAFSYGSGGTDNMQTQQPHIGDKQNPAVHLRERGLGELEDAVSRYLPTLYRKAYRYVGDPHDAEDAVQDALLSAYKHLHQFKGTAKMTTWLTTIVTNSALTQLRRRPRHPHVSLDERAAEDQDYCVSDRLADIKPNPESESIRSQLHGRLMQSVMKLSPSLQETIQLRYLDGLTLSEAAQTLGVSEGTIKARLWRARTKLKWLMRRMREGEDYTNELCTGCKTI
jgi:RNA polymerase sigma-70 factor, ECF subfamily